MEALFCSSHKTKGKETTGRGVSVPDADEAKALRIDMARQRRSLEFGRQLMTCYGEQEILQLMQVADADPGWRRMPQAEPFGVKHEIHMAVADAEDPFFPYKIAEAAFFEDLGRQDDGLEFLEFGLFYHIDKVGGMCRLVGAVGHRHFPADLDLGVINEGVAQDLLYCDDFAV